MLFYSYNLDLLPPKPKLSFRYLKQGIQEFHRKYVLAPADKAANNVVVVGRLYYINTLKQELGSTKAYERISTDERSIVNTHSFDITAKFAVSIKEKQDRLPMLYWLPKLHKRPYKACFIANFIRFGTKLYRQTVGIPMGTNCAPLVADLFLFCYERDFMKSFSRENQADIIEAFNSTLRYLDDLLNIDNIYFDQMVDRIYPTELQLNRANSSDTEAPFFGFESMYI